MNYFSLAGTAAALILFAAASLMYPGGYDWSRDFVSTMFAPTTASGMVNAARPYAMLAMFCLCASGAVTFKALSQRASGRALSKTLEIGGIGAMVYAFLVVTPMHDVLI